MIATSVLGQKASLSFYPLGRSGFESHMKTADPPPASPSGEPPSRAFRGLQLGCITLFSLCACVATSILVGAIVVLCFPPTHPSAPTAVPAFLPLGPAWLRFGLGITLSTASGPVPVGITFHPWNLPGTFLGVLVGSLALHFLVRVTRGERKA